MIGAIFPPSRQIVGSVKILIEILAVNKMDPSWIVSRSKRDSGENIRGPNILEGLTLRSKRLAPLAVLAACIVLASTGCSPHWPEGFQDNFENGMSTVWTSYGGDWTVAEGELAINAGNGYRCLAKAPDFTDFILEADVLAEGDAADALTGLVFRATNPGVGADNYRGYFVGITIANNAIVLGRADGGWAELARVPMVPALKKGTKYRLKVLAEGTRLRVYFADRISPVIEANDGTWSHGIVGLGSHLTASRFDNVIATDILF